MKTAIKTIDLTKKYKDVVAVNSLNIAIEEGELLALLGVNGAGKTTTIKMLAGILEPTSGDGILLGESIVKNPLRVKQHINISPQETAVARNLTVEENLEMIAGIYGMKRDDARREALEMMKKLGLEEIKKKKASKLSGGMQRRLSIGMALISKPQIIFLDEPTLGLDVIARRELWELIETLKGHITIILTTHYMEEAETLSDRVAIMAGGELKALGTVEELMEQTNAKDFEDAFITLATGGN